MPYIFNPLTGNFDFVNPSTTGGGGDVSGPASSTDTEVAIYDGTTGKVLKNSNVSIAELTAYTRTFNATSDWILNGAYYETVVLQSVHKKPNPAIQVFEQNGLVFEKVVTGVTIDASGNVTISVSSSPDLRFAGKLIIT